MKSHWPEEPDDIDAEYPCVCCGLNAYDCICPECPNCGEIGNTDCYLDGFLSYTPEQLKGQEELNRAIERDAQCNGMPLDDLESPW